MILDAKHRMDNFHICITGAGVVGLAIAFQLSQSPAYRNRSIVILDTEDTFGSVTSSRNSEVIHAGIYYAENSLKAKLCVQGKGLLYDFLQRHRVPFKQIGKLIVSSTDEANSLSQILDNANKNKVTDLKLLKRTQLKELEPALSAESALHSPSTGILDSHQYMEKLLVLAQKSGVIFAPRTRVENVSLNNGLFNVTARVEQTSSHDPLFYEFGCDKFINSAGLGAQNLAHSIAGMDSNQIPPLHPCKGDYFSYSGKNPFKHLIYPIPEKNHTGLGIHSTSDMSNQLRFGPDTEYIDYFDYSINESKRELFASAIKSYFPAVEVHRLIPAYSGIRPKLNGPGKEAADFIIQGPDVSNIDGLIQLFGMESPALTASLAIAEYVERLLISAQ